MGKKQQTLNNKTRNASTQRPEAFVNRTRENLLSFLFRFLQLIQLTFYNFTSLFSLHFTILHLISLFRLLHFTILHFTSLFRLLHFTFYKLIQLEFYNFTFLHAYSGFYRDSSILEVIKMCFFFVCVFCLYFSFYVAFKLI